MPESTRTWFSQALETVAIWWRLERRDGVTLGFTTHDRDLWFDGVHQGRDAQPDLEALLTG